MKLEIPHLADMLELGSRIVTAVETCAERLDTLVRALSFEPPRCKHCKHPIREDGTYTTGWTHFPYPPDPTKGWQGLRCPGALTGAEPE